MKFSKPHWITDLSLIALSACLVLPVYLPNRQYTQAAGSKALFEVRTGTANYPEKYDGTLPDRARDKPSLETQNPREKTSDWKLTGRGATSTQSGDLLSSKDGYWKLDVVAVFASIAGRVDGPALGCRRDDCHLMVIDLAFTGFEILISNRVAVLRFCENQRLSFQTDFLALPIEGGLIDAENFRRLGQT
jgi:hypothetical protein